MRTLQEKYNGIQEGKFSKENFLADARRELPNLVTRFNGYDDTVQILKNRGMIQETRVEEARLTKNSLTDYRYKPTNEMDKYPYEQILRGLRVELEGLGVHGTPTAEEYAKALAKVSKNLAKDSIFYTNLVAGVNPKVDLHDKMVPFTEKTAVDTFNGMKKAELKEGFKKLIKKVLSENMGDMFGDEERAARAANYGQPGENEYEFYSDPENYNEEEEEFDLHGEEEADDIPHPRGYEEASDEEDEIDYDDENFSDPFIDGDLDESKMGDLYVTAQESDSLKDFLIKVKQEYPETNLRRDIEELQHIWNNRGEEESEGDPGYQGFESPSDRAYKSDAWVQAQQDMMETKKPLSELLK